MPDDVRLLHADQEERPRPPSPARREMVLAVAILDLTGALLTVGAAAVLTLNDQTDQRWWWAVGLASALAVFTTVLLIRVEGQRRNFITASERLAEHLEGLAREGQPLPRDLRELARTRRDAAQASGHLAMADRLALVLASF